MNSKNDKNNHSQKTQLPDTIKKYRDKNGIYLCIHVSRKTFNENENMPGYCLGTVSTQTFAKGCFNQILGSTNLKLAPNRFS